jgi:protein phosphatase
LLLLRLPATALVLLIGPSGAGKSTFAARHFLPTEIISSDHCRALICDDASAQHVNAEAFGLVHHLTRLRLGLGRFTVIDATNLQYRARRPFLRLARRFGVSVVALVFDVSLTTCETQNRNRMARVVPEAVLQQHARALEQTLRRLPIEGYAQVYVLDEQNINEVTIERVKSSAS